MRCDRWRGVLGLTFDIALLSVGLGAVFFEPNRRFMTAGVGSQAHESNYGICTATRSRYVDA